MNYFNVSSILTIMSKLYIFAARQPLSSVISVQKCLMLFSSFSLFNAYCPPPKKVQKDFFLKETVGRTSCFLFILLSPCLDKFTSGYFSCYSPQIHRLSHRPFHFDFHSVSAKSVRL